MWREETQPSGGASRLAQTHREEAARPLLSLLPLKKPIMPPWPQGWLLPHVRARPSNTGHWGIKFPQEDTRLAYTAAAELLCRCWTWHRPAVSLGGRGRSIMCSRPARLRQHIVSKVQTKPSQRWAWVTPITSAFGKPRQDEDGANWRSACCIWSRSTQATEKSCS